MKFLKELQEARMTRNYNNQRMLTYNDCRERAYLIVLMLQTMRHYESHITPAAKYAFKTVMYRDYTRFRVDGSDLYNLFYFITGDETALGKLKDPGAAAQERKTTHLSVGKLNRFLRDLANEQKPSANDNNILMQLETELKITNNDYKEIRRRLGVFATDSNKERKTTVTRLLFAARAKLSDSDFLATFTRMTLDKGLEDFKTNNPELSPSIPDTNIAIDSIRNYRFLVPVSRLPLIAKFLQAGMNGKTIMANFVESYVPIMIMIDDIVRAGPAYVERLKQLHKQAKRDLKE